MAEAQGYLQSPVRTGRTRGPQLVKGRVTQGCDRAAAASYKGICRRTWRTDGAGLRVKRKRGVRNAARRETQGGHCPMASETAVAGQRRSHTSPSPGAKRSYLPGTQVRPEQSRRRIAFSKGARPLKDGKSDPSVWLYNLPAPVALPPPEDVTRGSGSPASPRPLPLAIRTSDVYASSLSKSGSQRGTGEAEAVLRGRGESGAGRSDVAFRFS